MTPHTPTPQYRSSGDCVFRLCGGSRTAGPVFNSLLWQNPIRNSLIIHCREKDRQPLIHEQLRWRYDETIIRCQGQNPVAHGKKVFAKVFSRMGLTVFTLLQYFLETHKIGEFLQKRQLNYLIT